jgi:hypothetical protein
MYKVKPVSRLVTMILILLMVSAKNVLFLAMSNNFLFAKTTNVSLVKLMIIVPSLVFVQSVTSVVVNDKTVYGIIKLISPKHCL